MRYYLTAMAMLICIALYSQTSTLKAIITPANIDSFISFNKTFEQNENKPAPSDKASFEFKNGTRKILFIAGHATNHIRNGDVKSADGGTGALAVSLNKLSNVPVLYTTYLSESDPNFEDENAF